MIVIALFISAALGIMIFPMLIPYLLLGYMALDGVASRQFIYNLKVSAGGVNIFIPDMLFAAGLFLAFFGILRAMLSGRFRRYAPLTKALVWFVMAYFVFFVVKLVNGYFEGVPLDSLVRRFALDTQCIYLFAPLLYLKSENSLRKLLYFTVLVCLLFPMAQPFLYGSADQIALERGQGGTLRLGFGNANLFLMLGVMAFFVWEKKIWLSALPLAGIAMLAQRSAFVALTLCVMALSFMKNKSLKFISLIGVAGLLLVAALFVIQATSDVPVVEKAAERLSQTFEKTGTTEARMLVIPQAMGEIANRPVTGYSYRDMHDLQRKEHRDAFSFNMLHPHNFVLSSLLRTGVFGSFLLFIIIGMALAVAYRLAKQHGQREQGMYLFSTMLFFVVFGLMNTSFVSAGYVFWVLMGITLWYANKVHLSKLQSRSTG